jgi:hypothetical protein
VIHACPPQGKVWNDFADAMNDDFNSANGWMPVKTKILPELMKSEIFFKVKK